LQVSCQSAFFLFSFCLFFFGVKFCQKVTRVRVQKSPHCKTRPQIWAILPNLLDDKWHNRHCVETLILPLSLSLPPPTRHDHEHYVGSLRHHALHCSSTFTSTYDMRNLAFTCSLSHQCN